jgi:hypothetical protein
MGKRGKNKGLLEGGIGFSKSKITLIIHRLTKSKKRKLKLVLGLMNASLI